MNQDFITVLSGVQVSPLFSVPDNSDENLEQILKILGLRDAQDSTLLQRALYLYRIVQSEPQVSQYLPADVVSQDYAGRLPRATYEGETAGIMQAASGPGSVVPVTPEDLSWPYPDTCTLTRATSSTAVFTCGSYSTVCSYSMLAENKVGIVLPKEFGIRGNILLTNTQAWNAGTPIHLPILFRYPVRTVVELLKKDNTVYELLDSYDFAAYFYGADRPEECIALIAVALYRRLTDG